MLPVELRATARVMPSEARRLEAFLDEYAVAVDGPLPVYL